MVYDRIKENYKITLPIGNSCLAVTTPAQRYKHNFLFMFFLVYILLSNQYVSWCKNLISLHSKLVSEKFRFSKVTLRLNILSALRVSKLPAEWCKPTRPANWPMTRTCVFINNIHLKLILFSVTVYIRLETSFVPHSNSTGEFRRDCLSPPTQYWSEFGLRYHHRYKSTFPSFVWFLILSFECTANSNYVANITYFF